MRNLIKILGRFLCFSSFIFSSFIFFNLLFSVAYAQVQDPEVSVSVSPNIATVGDVITYRISVVTDSSENVVFPELKGAVDPFSVYDIDTVVDEISGVMRSDLIATLRLFEVGDFSVPTQSVTLSSEQGLRSVDAPSVLVTITSVLSGAENKGLRDVKPLMNLAVDWAWYFFMGVSVLVLGSGVGFLVYWFYFRKGPDVSVIAAPKVDLRPMDTIFKEKIQYLKDLGFIEKGEFKTHYFLFSDIMKEYFSVRYKHQCQEMTTQELLEVLTTCTDEQTLKRIVKLFDVFDLSKYTKQTLDASLHDECFDKAIDIIDRTTLTHAI